LLQLEGVELYKYVEIDNEIYSCKSDIAFKLATF
jgi:hypothetical protein